ncbi:MlaE family lipid ABC transporter permease subunit [Aureimonas fodinaquatilis]|uniref:MlaE family lipid ABC transporter permease subunit n=1 Tax=Aureimonas fodinaquatilis TaxID=2565783 RepID=A0A5B0E1S5_9HYPH|nr:MlaE family lipid ABC transporter permease subunit [Aureimonas fodinaquatilis]KAA0972608.1 MlaE family lipid ABC transporter permease subunit [Aureimonas fodinaquatilis]
MADISQTGERQVAVPQISAEKAGDAVQLAISGDWLARTVGSVEKNVNKTLNTNLGTAVAVDCQNVGRLDTSGAYLIERLVRGLTEKGAKVTLEGVGKASEPLFEVVRRSLDTKHVEEAKPRRNKLLDMLEGLGRWVVNVVQEFIDGLNIIGASLYGAGRRLTGQTQFRPAAIVSQMDHMGVRALPIITLMSFLIGGVIAQQGAFQLRYFGAEIFVVDLVGILQLREIGVLLTAIMIAGRSGSAITAEIGSMKMREEVDALRVIGLNPIGVLVFPRLLALTLVLPLLAIVADLAGIAGAMVVTYFYSGITPEAFIMRLRGAIDVGTILAGVIKAPFMAIIIGVVAASEGLKVGGSAESLGRCVTSSVVKSIFLVILLDAMFAIFYAAIGY